MSEARFMKHGDLFSSVAGASYALQVHDRIAQGYGPPDEELRDRFIEEAVAVADLAVEAFKKSEHW